MPDGIKIEGLHESQAKLASLAKNVQRRVLKMGLKAGCKILLSKAQALAPVKTGKLLENIQIRSKGDKDNKARMSVGVGKKDFTGAAWYAGAIIYGHKQWVPQKGYKKGEKRQMRATGQMIPANNFLEKAFDSEAQSAAKAIGDKWIWEIEKRASSGGT
jgi:HK97 gp10 family phage protein